MQPVRSSDERSCQLNGNDQVSVSSEAANWIAHESCGDLQHSSEIPDQHAKACKILQCITIYIHKHRYRAQKTRAPHITCVKRRSSPSCPGRDLRQSSGRAKFDRLDGIRQNASGLSPTMFVQRWNLASASAPNEILLHGILTFRSCQCKAASAAWSVAAVLGSTL